MKPPALRFRQVTKRYGRLVALNGMDLLIPAGSICGFIGPNGAGKTTAMGVAAGVLSADGGEVDLLGLGPFDAERHRGRVSLLPQDCELNPYTPIHLLLRTLGQVQGMTRGEAERDVERLLNALGLEDKRDARINTLSHGMRRRVTIAQAFLGSPEFIMLDEPVSGLDPHLVVQVRTFLASYRGRCTLLISSHQLDELEKVCDSVVFVEGGRVVQAGALEQVKGQVAEVKVIADRPLVEETWVNRWPHWQIRVEADALYALDPQSDFKQIPHMNRSIAEEFWKQGIGVVSIHSGSSLEQTYLRSRGLPQGPK